MAQPNTPSTLSTILLPSIIQMLLFLADQLQILQRRLNDQADGATQEHFPAEMDALAAQHADGRSPGSLEQAEYGQAWRPTDTRHVLPAALGDQRSFGSLPQTCPAYSASNAYNRGAMISPVVPQAGPSRQHGSEDSSFDAALHTAPGPSDYGLQSYGQTADVNAIGSEALSSLVASSTNTAEWSWIPYHPLVPSSGQPAHPGSDEHRGTGSGRQ